MKPQNRYGQILEHLFKKHFEKGKDTFEFERRELEEACHLLGIERPRNLGDIPYSFRYRSDFPTVVQKAAPKGSEWIIEGAGKGRYRFRLVKVAKIEPRPDLAVIKIPDATPEIVTCYSFSDEQALLAKIRYNRLIDIFLGITAYSLQNHLRTTVKGIGQVEVDEIYVGVNRGGSQFIVPIQAKGGKDAISAVQAAQDIAMCREKFPRLACRPVSAQFLDESRIALFELVDHSGEIRVREERHYALVPSSEISDSDLEFYFQG